MKKEYVTWLTHGDKLQEEQEIELTIRYLTSGPHKYDGHNVRAIVASSPEKLPEADILWIRAGNGLLHPQPWAIKIIGELGKFLSRNPFDYAALLEKKD